MTCNCSQGSLGYAPDGERVFCDCLQGLQAQMADSVILLGNYADQLQAIRCITFPSIPTRMEYDVIRTAYDDEMLVHDWFEAALTQRRMEAS